MRAKPKEGSLEKTLLIQTAGGETPAAAIEPRLPEQPRAPNRERLPERIGSIPELRAFMNAHADEIHSKARMLCYGSTERADEVLQELYPRLVSVLRRNPSGFDNAWAMIHRVAARLAIDSYRKHRRALRTKQLLEPGELTDAARPPPDMPDSEALHAAISSLPDRLKFIVLGIFIDGCKAKDIARRIGLSESRVAELKQDALTMLRRHLS